MTDTPTTAELGPTLADLDRWREPDVTDDRLLRRPPAWQRRLWRALATAPLVGLAMGGLLAVVLVALSAMLSHRGPTTWTSTTVMIIDDPYQLATAGDEGQLLKLDYLRYKYSALVSTDAIADPVAAKLGVPVGSVLSSVSAPIPASSLLLDIVATTSGPGTARLLSQTVADEVTAYVQGEDKAYAIPAQDQFTLTTVDPASPPVSHSPSLAHTATVAGGFAVLGLVVGFCGAQLLANRKLLR